MATDIQCTEEKNQQQIEEETLRQLLILERVFREHNALTKKELQLQKELVSRIWILAQRYILLESTGTCCRYPEIYSGPAEDTLLQEFTEKLKQIRSSNCLMSNSLDELRKSCLVFNNLCSQLNMEIESSLITGDAFHKPIAYFIELISDLFKYFHAWLLKLKYSSQQFDPVKIESIENYKKQIEISEDFEEYLNVGLAYCKCLRPKTSC
ncbi:uncharacterized protein LOC111690357 [Lucilia cuprina]|uniref:uncharacterized protein LOC111690357 n=1 Tax=Lucilia cuprina TaxID=7375 RepID=UPI001F05FF7E|nr:uncharacterized protein LOC111690357 [Lucilia cuprina]